ncbi:hypothetical protein FHX81_4311 [Saccharothrix saharensis]|uniref:Uncharacterized protein n=1 Tax=Saccharothrix saharensis TaxID=571190 RepID=A0A543JGP3_9PSEU|nr:hypothetical protein FHX81_4311 [Saccharothrix saharensis]
MMSVTRPAAAERGGRRGGRSVSRGERSACGRRRGRRIRFGGRSRRATHTLSSLPGLAEHRGHPDGSTAGPKSPRPPPTGYRPLGAVDRRTPSAPGVRPVPPGTPYPEHESKRGGQPAVVAEEALA